MFLNYKKRRNSQNSLLVLLAFFVLLNSGTYWAHKLNLTHFISEGTPDDEHSLGKFVASIQLRSHQKPTFGWYHLCGGTIISSKKILTAAHCLIKRPGILYKPCEIVVVVGMRQRFNRTSQTQVKNVALVKAHKAFGRDTTYFADVGFLILKKEIIFNDHVAKIGIPQSPDHAINKICTVIGWGKIFDKGPTSDRILFVDVEIIRIRNCKKIYRSSLTPGMLCAASPENWNKDSCAGDSGGPLICGDIIAGIVSWGVGCGYEHLPGVYTDVSYFEEWISKALCLRRANYLIAIVLFNFLLEY